MNVDLSDVPMKEEMFMCMSDPEREAALIRVFRTLEADDKQMLFGTACIMAHRIELRSEGKIINMNSKKMTI